MRTAKLFLSRPLLLSQSVRCTFHHSTMARLRGVHTILYGQYYRILHTCMSYKPKYSASRGMEKTKKRVTLWPLSNGQKAEVSPHDTCTLHFALLKDAFDGYPCGTSLALSSLRKNGFVSIVCSVKRHSFYSYKRHNTRHNVIKTPVLYHHHHAILISSHLSCYRQKLITAFSIITRQLRLISRRLGEKGNTSNVIGELGEFLVKAASPKLPPSS